MFRFLKVSDIGSDFIYREDLLSFLSSPKVYKVSALDKEDLVFLMASYRKMFPLVSMDIMKTIFTKIIKKFGFINFRREFLVKSSKRKIKFIRNFNIMCNWSRKLWPFFVRSSSMQGEFLFFSYSFDRKKYITNVLAKVLWYKEYSERFKHGSALQMWHSIKFESLINNCFIPIQKIHCRFSKGHTYVGKDLMCVCPILRRVLSDLNM